MKENGWREKKKRKIKNGQSRVGLKVSQPSQCSPARPSPMPASQCGQRHGSKRSIHPSPPLPCNRWPARQPAWPRSALALCMHAWGSTKPGGPFWLYPGLPCMHTVVIIIAPAQPSPPACLAGPGTKSWLDACLAGLALLPFNRAVGSGSGSVRWKIFSPILISHLNSNYSQVQNY